MQRNPNINLHRKLPSPVEKQRAVNEFEAPNEWVTGWVHPTSMTTCAVICRIIRVHLKLPPASCCTLWINYHGNLKLHKTLVNTMITCLGIPARKESCCHKQVLHNCDTNHHNHIFYMYIISEYECTCNQPWTERMEELFRDVIYKYNMIYKTYWQYLHIIDTLLIHSYMSTLKYVYTVYMYIFICIQIYQRRNK